MVPLVDSTTAGGTPISSLMSEATVNQIVQRTRDGGAEIVGLLKTGSAYYAPSAAVAQMVDAVVLDKKRVLPCAAYLEGEYQVNGVFLGVPVKLGAGGVEEIIEVHLSEDEKTALDKSVASVRELLDLMHNRSKEQ